MRICTQSYLHVYSVISQCIYRLCAVHCHVRFISVFCHVCVISVFPTNEPFFRLDVSVISMSHFVRSTSVSPTQPGSLSPCLSSSLSLLSLSRFRSLSPAFSLTTSFSLFLPLPPSLYLSLPPLFSSVSLFLSASYTHTRTGADELAGHVRARPVQVGVTFGHGPKIAAPTPGELDLYDFPAPVCLYARQHVAVFCIALLCLAVWCSVLSCVAVRCSV